MFAFVCPGQGSQSVGMGKALAEAFPEARAVFEEVDDTLSQKLSQLMFEGPIEVLTQTQNAQPALFAVSAAIHAVIQKSTSAKPAYVAGHSLGEYSALVIAGVLDIATTTKLLRHRGNAMSQAVPANTGAMAAILGLDCEALHGIVATAAEGQVCVVANDNAPGQVVISGHAEAVERASALATQAGAKRAVMLPVSGPFHSPLMAPAADAMAQALGAIKFHAPLAPVVANVTAAPESNPDRLRQLLVEQVTGQVRWRESVAQMAARGVTRLIEVGAGKVLTGLGKRIAPDISHEAIHTPEELEIFINSL